MKMRVLSFVCCFLALCLGEVLVSATSPLIAEIRMFAGNFPPRGWAFCDGQILPIAQNTALFSLLGTTYGGNGQTTFALPDLRGRVPMHAGQGPGLSPRNLGEQGGQEVVTLTSNQMPVHTHLVSAASNDVATENSPVNNFFGKPTLMKPYSGSADSTMNAQTIVASGGNQPHTNIQPFLVSCSKRLHIPVTFKLTNNCAGDQLYYRVGRNLPESKLVVCYVRSAG